MERHTEFMFGVPWIMGFFHQDWSLDASMAAEAVAHQFVEELEPTAVLLVRRDAQLLLGNLTSAQIEALWVGCLEWGHSFFPRRVADGAEWMRQVIGVCDAWLSCRTETPTLSGADQYEGRELAGQVLTEVAEFGSVLDLEVADALSECVRSCTPDLAFRLLLRALSERNSALPMEQRFSLTREQYARLEEIGRALNYGEYVVSDIKYLVDS
ncbi:hypothetical protein [Streptomyces flaveus]|uniref:CdiI immunity protein domain-containing protein n=1 Tax=Streptomyces flaveus TaxID=66370 RepID=A0A917QHS0_9ACTN|nr:hypothetical protein [Streptomyces flaveus]GGK51196.1 hypothetical protein GCM10010094_09280 [Streptomyces flaveus]